MSNGLSPEREAELERKRVELRNQWRIAEECCLPEADADKAFAMVLLEMKFFCPDFMRAMSVATNAKRWIETRNPFHIDSAVILCHLSGIQPSPALASLVADVANLRMQDATRGGTAAKVRKEGAKDYALNLMTILCAAGANRDVAASKVARLLADNDGGISFKASALDKFYTKQWKRLEYERRHYFATNEGAPILAEWRRILPSLPEADDELKGNRRQ